MKSFEFHRPQSVDEAVAFLKAHDAAKLLAGGQSLLPVLKLDLAEPSDLLSLQKLSGLKGVQSDGDALVVGALTTHDEVARSAEVQKRIPGLAALASGIGDAQVRNRGTLGGSVAHADPSADYPAAVVALNATVSTDRRKIAADDFFTGLFATALAADEIVTEVRFPVPEKAGYAKFPHPASKYAIVGVFVAKTAGGVRVAVTGAGAKVFRLPAVESALGAKFTADAVPTVTAASLAGAALRSEGGSPEYVANLITVMARRAVQACG